jgi:hypothetical protein
MTKKTRNWLIVLLSIPGAVIFAVIGLLIFQQLQPLPPIQPLPNPNGYGDFIKAGEMASTNSWDYEAMNEAQLREAVAVNIEALSFARVGLTNKCHVTTQFSLTYLNNHLNELADLKRLARAFAAEGRLAEMENHPTEAAKSYLDAIHMGNESARGGVLIDQLVGTAIKAIGTSHLQKLVDQLDAKSCRETAATLEALDSQGQTWNEIMQQENTWSRRTFTSLRYRIFRPLLVKMTKKVLQQAEQRFNKQVAQTRQLLIDLAARAYELDKGHRPANLNDLVPDYLKAIPQDPLTGTNMVHLP